MASAALSALVHTVTETDDIMKRKSIQTQYTVPPKPEPSLHYRDWPNDIGFESDFVQDEPIELNVTGNIPAWAAGTLYRTGPGIHSIDCNNGRRFETHHWFDGFTVVHRFQIKVDEKGQVKVSYNSRSTTDKLIERIRRTGQSDGFSFAQKRDPCQSFFKKLMSFFAPEAGMDPEATNVGVALSSNMPGFTATNKSDPTSHIRSLATRTDAARYQTLDPNTLEPAGVCDQTVLHPALKGAVSGTHAKSDPDTGDVYNFNLEPGRKSNYRIFCASTSTGKTEILATFEAPPAYIHSIFLTQNTVVLCVWNSHFAARGLSILYHRNVMDAISPLDSNEPARWYVVDRSPARKGLIATYHTPAFFCFHTINAYEEPSEEEGKIDITADLIAYSDLSVLHRFYYKNLLSSSPDAVKYVSQRHDAYRGTFSRYRLPDVPLPEDSKTPAAKSSSSQSTPRKGHLVHQSSKADSLELPTLSPLRSTRKYRYHYGVSDSGLSTFFDGIGKYDTQSHKALFWRKEGHTPGEPIFVPNPSSRAKANSKGVGAENKEDAKERKGMGEGGNGDSASDGQGEDQVKAEGVHVSEEAGAKAEAEAEDDDDDDDQDEDSGVLLSVVLDGHKQESYLLVLDARTMQEVGRAEMPSGPACEGGATSADGVQEAKAEGKNEDGGEGESEERASKRLKQTEPKKTNTKMVVGFGFHGLHVPERAGGVVSGGD